MKSVQDLKKMQEEKIINMLKENNDSWQIQGNQIVFDSNKLIDEYNSYVNELN